MFAEGAVVGSPTGPVVNVGAMVVGVSGKTGSVAKYSSMGSGVDV
jgi:hypothetical protein